MATLWAARSLAGGSHELRRPLIAIGVSALLPIILHWTMRRTATWSRAFEVLFLVVMVLAIVRLWRGALEPFPYGDGLNLRDFIRDHFVFAVWLLGLVVASWLYAGIWQFPPIAAILPATLATPLGFTAVLCTVVMGVGSLALLRSRPNSLAVVLPALTPVWILFSIGYVEYYPLMIGGWLAILFWIFDRPMSDRSPWAIGVLVGFLPTLYVTFVPVSAILIVFVLVTRPADALRVLGAALATFALIVTACYPGGVQAFIPMFFRHMDLGDTNMLFPRYRGRMAGPNTIFFTAGYALSLEHIKDLLFMVFWGAGWPLPWLVASAAWIAAKRRDWRERHGDHRLLLGGMLVIWLLINLTFVPAKMGPAKDVDLYCPIYVALAFMAGRVFDALGVSNRPGIYPFLCALTGTAVATASLMAWVWLIRRP